MEDFFLLIFQLGNRNLEEFGRFISFLEVSPCAACVKGEGFPLPGFLLEAGGLARGSEGGFLLDSCLPAAFSNLSSVGSVLTCTFVPLMVLTPPAFVLLKAQRIRAKEFGALHGILFSLLQQSPPTSCPSAFTCMFLFRLSPWIALLCLFPKIRCRIISLLFILYLQRLN
ncbi:hypothetical protein EK904_000018 [Melospiza melodia maxima]|nr:hypothetical protein EK904_000018 [Melospiza melodia maxima]